MKFHCSHGYNEIYILSDLCGREVTDDNLPDYEDILSDLCGREDIAEFNWNVGTILSDLCGREGQLIANA